MTIKDILQKNKKIPIIDAELLLSFVLKKDKTFLHTYPEYKLNKKELEKYARLIYKRLNGYSVASLTGSKDFYGLEFIVDKNILIPRPETELMIDEALNILDSRLRGNDKGKRKESGNDKGKRKESGNDKEKKDENDRVREGVLVHKEEEKRDNKITLIDLGTGSGCIPISILKTTLESNLEKIRCFAIDISSKALQIAQKNAKKHALTPHIRFLQGNLLEPIIQSNIPHQKQKIIITANLPYLTKKQIENSPSIQKEPTLALWGGKNGMDYYLKLFKQIKILQKKYNPSSITVLAEIDHTQATIFKKEANKLIPSSKLEIKKDLGGYERLIIISI